MGGNVVINADDYTAQQIKEIIFAGKTKGSSVVIKKSKCAYSFAMQGNGLCQSKSCNI